MVVIVMLIHNEISIYMEIILARKTLKIGEFELI